MESMSYDSISNEYCGAETAVHTKSTLPSFIEKKILVLPVAWQHISRLPALVVGSTAIVLQTKLCSRCGFAVSPVKSEPDEDTPTSFLKHLQLSRSSKTQKGKKGKQM